MESTAGQPGQDEGAALADKKEAGVVELYIGQLGLQLWRKVVKYPFLDFRRQHGQDGGSQD